MSNTETETRPDTRIMPTNPGFMQVGSIEAAMQCAELIAKSSFCPKGMVGKPGDVVIALQMGQELGLKPMQALQNIAVINGRPSLWGDAMLAVCRQSPDFEYIKEEYLEETKTYVCRVKRKYEPEFMQTFSEADAKLARLWGKEGPWTQYPRRMLQFRARGFCLRDAYPDLLRGIITCEEAEDMPKERVDYSRKVGNIYDSKISDGEIITPHQLDVLKDLMQDADSKPENICSHLKIEYLEMMPLSKWEGVCRLLQQKIAKKRKIDLPINQVYEAKKVSEAVAEFDREYEEG
jgi:hypothetical protein